MTEEDVHAVVRRQNPTEQRVVSLPITTEIKALSLVKEGMFRSFDEVVETAIDALSLALTQGQPGPRSNQSRRKTTQFEAGDLTVPYVARVSPPDFGWPADVTSVQVPVVPPVPRDRFVKDILLFTVPRLLPVKLVTRVLIGELGRQGSRWVEFDAFDRVLGPQALQWREYLYRLDRTGGRGRGELLSTALPSGKRDVGKSLSRFRDAYAGFVYKNGRLYGASPFLELTSLEGSRNELRIGLTEAGVQFAKMENPVFDGEKNVFPPFSEDEVDFVLKQLSHNSPREAEHIAFYLRVLRDDPESTRKSVNDAMRPFYTTVWDPLSLTREQVDSTRAALHSRCQELGLAGTVRVGKAALYLATADGLDWIPTLSRGTGGLSEVSA